MQKIPYISILSMIISLLIISFKLVFYIESYIAMKDIISMGDANPTVVAGGFKVALISSIPIISSLILSIIAVRRNIKFAKASFILSILAFVYILIPIGIILTLL